MHMVLEDAVIYKRIKLFPAFLTCFLINSICAFIDRLHRTFCTKRHRKIIVRKKPVILIFIILFTWFKCFPTPLADFHIITPHFAISKLKLDIVNLQTLGSYPCSGDSFLRILYIHPEHCLHLLQRSRLFARKRIQSILPRHIRSNRPPCTPSMIQQDRGQTDIRTCSTFSLFRFPFSLQLLRYQASNHIVIYFTVLCQSIIDIKGWCHI